MRVHHLLKRVVRGFPFQAPVDLGWVVQLVVDEVAGKAMLEGQATQQSVEKVGIKLGVQQKGLAELEARLERRVLGDAGNVRMREAKSMKQVMYEAGNRKVLDGQVHEEGHGRGGQHADD